MSSERTPRVFDLLAEARARQPEDRDAFLDEACGGDEALHAELTALLALGEQTDESPFLETPAVESLRAWQTEKEPLEPDALFGPFRIVRLLGRGGDGLVYEAEQQRPHRRVALKIPREQVISAPAQRRFEAEAGHLARLHHPGIAQIYDVGVHEGEVYFALELVEGARTIADYAREQDLAIEERVRLVAEVADAIQHAHAQGLLHRDLKPANVLVTPRGRPKVIDFGIALVREPEDEGPQDVAGTPPYMSPEQLHPLIDVRSDVFGLGVLLYEVLTGRLPGGQGAAPDGDPAPLGIARRRWRDDLEAIAHKALRRDRERRYASAGEFASDLRHCLRSEPVGARPSTARYRLRCWLRRRRVEVAAALVAMLGLLVSGGLAAVVLSKASEERHTAQVASRTARWASYRAALARAQSALQDNRVSAAIPALDEAPAEHRGWAWRHLYHSHAPWRTALILEARSIREGALSPTGRLAAAEGLGSDSGQVRIGVFDLEQGSLQQTLRPGGRSILALAFDREEAVLYVGDRDGHLDVYDLRTGARRLRKQAHAASVNDLAVHPQTGQVLTASSDGTIGIWTPEDLEPAGALTGHADRVICLAFAADGRLAAGDRTGGILIWDVGAERVLQRLVGHESSVEDLAFSPDGQRLVSGSRDGTVRLWDMESGNPIAVHHDHGATVRAVDFAPDGSTFASGGWDRTIRFWNGADGSALGVRRGRSSFVCGIAYRGARELLSFSGAIDTWIVPPVADPYVAHGDPVCALAWGPEGRHLASVAQDGSLVVWAVERATRQAQAQGETRCIAMAFAPTGSALTRVEANGRVIEMDSLTGAETHRFSSKSRSLRAGWVDPEGEYVIVATKASDVEVFDPRSGRQVASWRPPRNDIRSLTALPRLGLVATGDDAGGVEVSRLATGERVATFRSHTRPVYALAFSERGDVLASCSQDGTAVLYAPAEGKILHVLGSAANGWLQDLAFTRDGRRLLTAGGDGLIRVWDVRTGDLVLAIRGHPEHGIPRLCFSPDGDTLAYACGYLESPQAIRFLHATSGKQVEEDLANR